MLLSVTDDVLHIALSRYEDLQASCSSRSRKLHLRISDNLGHSFGSALLALVLNVADAYCLWTAISATATAISASLAISASKSAWLELV